MNIGHKITIHLETTIDNEKILVIDNYDSFTYNLVHYLEDLNCEVTVYRNDEFELDEINHFDKILLTGTWYS
jgi:anthranilate/para-aminobenzoate synthase component II